MRKIVLPFTLLTVAAFSLPAAPAQAQAARTFVSAAGSDSNNCTSVATPCRHFQAAVNATFFGGEVVALDPANYGSFTISQAITIQGQGWSYVTPPNTGNGITINAGGPVTIRGVLLNGEGASGGTNGIVFNSGSSLTVTDCLAQNFVDDITPQPTGNGILIAPAAGAMTFVIANTIVSNNGFAGILYQPPSGTPSANGVIDHLVANANMNGIYVNLVHTSGGISSIAISNSIASNNRSTGVGAYSGSSTLTVAIDNYSFCGNAYYGIDGVQTT
jgi:hypothetical protein